MRNKILSQIDKNIIHFLKQTQGTHPFHLAHPLLFKAISNFALRKGKRIRPLLLILSYCGYTKKKPHPSIYQTAISLEFLHLFMLIHDDIIDNADLRRNQPTLHRLLENITPCTDQKKLGENLAIIAGDIVYAMAIESFFMLKNHSCSQRKAFEYFLQTTITTAIGEFVDTLYGHNSLHSLTEENVFLTYSLKTARYTFMAPLVIGAMLSHAPKKDLKHLETFGLLIGHAFQIQDDIIGIYESEKTIGKSILCDLEEQKKTLLIVHANQCLKGRFKKDFVSLFTKPKKTLKDLKMIQSLLIQSGSLQYSLQKLHEATNKAKKILQQLSIKPTYKKLIGETLFELFHPSTLVMQSFLPSQINATDKESKTKRPLDVT